MYFPKKKMYFPKVYIVFIYVFSRFICFTLPELLISLPKKKKNAKALQKLKKMKLYDDITKFRNKYITGMAISAL